MQQISSAQKSEASNAHTTTPENVASGLDVAHFRDHVIAPLQTLLAGFPKLKVNANDI